MKPNLILRSSAVNDCFTLFTHGESESNSKSVLGEPVLGVLAARSKRGVGVVGGRGAVLLETKGV
jgi:hypothetical protein